MPNRVPTCAVALPIHNGEDGIAAAISSVRAQTDVALRCIVRLNGCTDESESIARIAIGGDQRFDVLACEELVGPGESFRLAAQLTAEMDCAFFTWIAAGDEFAPDYLARAIESLNADPHADWALAYTRFVDKDRREISTHCPSHRLASSNAFLRLLTFACQERWNEIYAVYGESCRPDVESIEDGFGFDVLLSWRLLLRGPPVQLGIVGTDYELVRKVPTSAVSRIRFKWTWACSERELRWGTLWLGLFQAAKGAPDLRTARQARVALSIAAFHPRWQKKFAEHAVNASARRVRRLMLQQHRRA